jgi:uncharacterized membrane protein
MFSHAITFSAPAFAMRHSFGPFAIACAIFASTVGLMVVISGVWGFAMWWLTSSV